MKFRSNVQGDGADFFCPSSVYNQFGTTNWTKRRIKTLKFMICSEQVLAKKTYRKSTNNTKTRGRKIERRWKHFFAPQIERGESSTQFAWSRILEGG